MFKCPFCIKEYDSIISLSKHGTRSHNISSKELYMKYYNLIENPKCKCGCGEETTYLDFGRGFREYKLGHVARVNNNWGHNKKALEKSIETRREMFQNNELIVWNSGLTKNDDERIKKQGETFSKNMSDEFRQVLSKRFKQNRMNGITPTLYGSQHSQWKGGISPLNNMCRSNTKLYKEWKYPLLVAAGFKCIRCGIADSKLEVHHNKESFSSILRMVAKQNNWEENLATKTRKDDKDLFELKQKISNEVAQYHVDNNISGLVLCINCHELEHKMNNIIDED